MGNPMHILVLASVVNVTADNFFLIKKVRFVLYVEGFGMNNSIIADPAS